MKIKALFILGLSFSLNANDGYNDLLPPDARAHEQLEQLNVAAAGVSQPRFIEKIKGYFKQSDFAKLDKATTPTAPEAMVKNCEWLKDVLGKQSVLAKIFEIAEESELLKTKGGLTLGHLNLFKHEWTAYRKEKCKKGWFGFGLGTERCEKHTVAVSAVFDSCKQELTQEKSPHAALMAAIKRKSQQVQKPQAPVAQPSIKAELPARIEPNINELAQMAKLCTKDAEKKFIIADASQELDCSQVTLKHMEKIIEICDPENEDAPKRMYYDFLAGQYQVFAANSCEDLQEQYQERLSREK